jgi:hypothetical protein
MANMVCLLSDLYNTIVQLLVSFWVGELSGWIEARAMDLAKQTWSVAYLRFLCVCLAGTCSLRASLTSAQDAESLGKQMSTGYVDLQGVRVGDFLGFVHGPCGVCEPVLTSIRNPSRNHRYGFRFDFYQYDSTSRFMLMRTHDILIYSDTGQSLDTFTYGLAPAQSHTFLINLITVALVIKTGQRWSPLSLCSKFV